MAYYGSLNQNPFGLGMVDTNAVGLKTTSMVIFFLYKALNRRWMDSDINEGRGIWTSVEVPKLGGVINSLIEL